VFAHFGMWSEAAGAWSDALDTQLGPYRCVDAWRAADALSAAPPEQLLRQHGAHGLLLAGGALCGKLAAFAYAHGDAGRRLEAARLAARLVAALFCCDVAHPQRAAGFALHAPAELWPGADLLGGADAYMWVTWAGWRV
jgi:hypothetical protein